MIAERIRIRHAIPLDRSYILHVNRQAWEHCYTHIFSQQEIAGLFGNVLHQHGSWVYRRNERISTLIAEVNSKVVGFIGMASLLNEPAGEVTTFYVLPEYQGRGIGKRLWQAAIRRFKNDNFRGVWVWVLEKADAKKFYEARGCVAQKKGTYSVGDHKENAVGYYLAL